MVVEFAGSPKAGKSTNIEILVHFFKRMKFKVWAPVEGASRRTPYHLKRDLVAFNAWSLNYAISEILVAFYNVDRHDLVILDRGPFDSLAWMNLLQKRGALSKEDLCKIEQFALLGKWWDMVSVVYLFTCNPAISLQREGQSKLTSRQGIAMNPEMLAELRTEYGAWPSSERIKQIDTTKTAGPLDTAYPIAVDIIERFKTKLKGMTR